MRPEFDFRGLVGELKAAEETHRGHIVGDRFRRSREAIEALIPDVPWYAGLDFVIADAVVKTLRRSVRYGAIDYGDTDRRYRAQLYLQAKRVLASTDPAAEWSELIDLLAENRSRTWWD